MNKMTTRLWAGVCLLLVQAAAFAQNAPINFEAGGFGATWTWTVFENATNPPVQVIANPSPGGVNTSATVARFTALQAGQPWAGCESLHGSDIGTFSFDETNCTVKIMVYKSVISDVGIKFATASGQAEVQLLQSNTLINQWEELTFDFSPRIGNPASTNIDQIIIFPDFDMAGRTSDRVIYFDNITFSERLIPAGPEQPAPTPLHAASGVISLFSNAYSNVTVNTWSAAWDQAEVSTVQIQGNDAKLYTNLTYAGIEFTAPTIDATEMTHFHMDIWTHDPTAAPAEFSIKLVDFGANGVWNGGGDDVEHELTFTASTTPALVSDAWVSFDLPLADFTGLVTTGHLAQLVITSDPNSVYVDNVYLYSNVLAVDDTPAARPAGHVLGPNHPNPFNPSTRIGFELAAPGHVTLSVYDVQGRRVRQLVDGQRPAGVQDVSWDGSNETHGSVASGVYLYQLAVDGRVVDTRCMVLLK
jgi:hypothetical protein